MSRAVSRAVVLATLGTTLVLAQLVVPLSKKLSYLGGGAANPHTDPTQAIQRVLNVPADVASLLDRACADCHSNETRWPWYSHVAPVSWLIVNDVHHGRVHLNLSEWSTARPSERRRLLENICKLTTDGTMPPSRYTWLHRAVRPTEDEIPRLCAWTRRAIDNMVTSDPGAGEAPDHPRSHPFAR